MSKITSLELRELVAESKIKSMWNGYRIDCYDESLQPFFDNLESNNDILHLFKSAERQNSVYGTSMFYFDIDKNTEDIKMGVYIPNPVNETMKMDGITEFASIGVRQLSRNKSGIIFQIKECRTEDELRVVTFNGNTAIDKFTLDVFQIKTPTSIKEAGATRSVSLPYGVLSAKQFLNKNIIDWEINEFLLRDSYGAESVEEQIIQFMEFMSTERSHNITRVLGEFSDQDLIAAGKPEAIMDNLNSLVQMGIVDSTLSEDYYDRFASPAQILGKTNVLLKTAGAAGDIKILQSNYNQEMQSKGFNTLMETYFLLCGLDYGIKSEAGSNKTTSEIKSENRTTYETIKTANALRTAEITEWIERIMIASNIEPEDMKEKWSFTIISNILEEEDANKQVIIDMQTNNLISSEEAIKRANPTMSSHDLEVMINDIETEKEEQKEEQAQEDKSLKKEN